MKITTLAFTFLSVVNAAVTINAAEPMQIENPLKQTKRTSDDPVEIALFLTLIDGSNLFLESKAENVDFHVVVRNISYRREEYRAQQEKQLHDNKQCSEKQSKADNLRTSNTSVPDKTDSCGLKIEKEFAEWILMPSFHVHKVVQNQEGNWIRTESWAFTDLGAAPRLSISGRQPIPDMLLGNAIQMRGSFNQSVIRKLGEGVFLLEVSLDTAAVPNINLLNKGRILGGTRFTICRATTIFEKMRLDRQDILESAKMGEWTQVLAKADVALGQYPENDAAEFYVSKGEALEKLGRLEDAIAAYDRYLALRTDTRANYMPVLIRGKVTDLKRTRDAKKADAQTK